MPRDDNGALEDGVFPSLYILIFTSVICHLYIPGRLLCFDVLFIYTCGLHFLEAQTFSLSGALFILHVTK